MKSFSKLKKTSSFFVLFCTFFCGMLSASNAGFSQVKVVGSTVFSAWQGQDANTTFATIEAAVGSISADPSTWTHTVFTNSTDYATAAPFLTVNANGDALIVYEFYDTVNDYSLTAAAMLPSGTSTWAVNTISDSTYSADQGDQVGHVDELGNVVAMWARYNPSLEEQQVVVSTSSISATPTWSTPAVLSQ